MTSPLTVSAASDQAANLYDLQGKDLHISYSTTGIDGKPHFTYQHGKKILNFSGDQIRTVGTEIGTLVTVTIVNTVDTGSTSFSLLIPAVNLDQTTREAPIKTEGITTIHKFSVIPAFNSGQTDNYKFSNLTGTAKAVVF
ncbi:MAG: hypothetical protein EPN17_10635 [Methylobacter sp.]|nr:MAG: hypothetical protein EPN17_10635 [Methylobacter sp.]